MKFLSRSIIVALLAGTGWVSADIAPGDSEWPSAYPAWWYNAADPANGVVDATQPTLNQNNDAPIVLGQLKQIASEARDELDTVLAPIGGAGTEIDTQVDGFTVQTPSNLSPANLGQLKNVSSSFYERFADIGFTPVAPDPNLSGSFLPIPLTAERSDGSAPGVPIYPWSQNVTPTNHAPALIGQAKHLFSWDLQIWATEDSENAGTGDGLPDWWERYYFGDLTPTAQGDEDGDALSNFDEYQAGTNPSAALSLDGDSIPDDWEVYYGLDVTPGVDGSGFDPEPDGLTHASEFAAGTDPMKRDHPDVILNLY